MPPKETDVLNVRNDDDAERLAAEILDPKRRVPIIGLSTRSHEDQPPFDPDEVRKIVGPEALIRIVKTGPATRTLDTRLPQHFGVFGGATRVWWPGVNKQADPRKHPRILDRQDRYGPRAYSILGEQFAAGPPEPLPAVPQPRTASDDQISGLAIPAAVIRDRTRAHHLEIVAAWLARDHAAGRLDRPMGPLAIGPEYLDALEQYRDRVSPAAVAVIAARIASGKGGEANDLDVQTELEADGSPLYRKDDGAACWNCRIPDAPGLRLRWWTRDDGAIELQDLVEEPDTE